MLNVRSRGLCFAVAKAHWINNVFASRWRCDADGNLTLPAQLTFRGDLVADMVIGCPLFCGPKGTCLLKNGEPKCVCDCGWTGFGCSVAEGYCPLPVSYLLPGNTSNVPAASAVPNAAASTVTRTCVSPFNIDQPLFRNMDHLPGELSWSAERICLNTACGTRPDGESWATCI